MLQEGETLWHLAARLAIPIEQLLTLNPKIPEHGAQRPAQR